MCCILGYHFHAPDHFCASPYTGIETLITINWKSFVLTGIFAGTWEKPVL
jgi:hypothetical protein